MDEEQLRKLVDGTQQDAAETALENTAKQVGAHWHNLTTNGVPDGLARQLIRDWNYLQWCKAFWPDTPPYMPGGDE